MNWVFLVNTLQGFILEQIQHPNSNASPDFQNATPLLRSYFCISSTDIKAQAAVMRFRLVIYDQCVVTQDATDVMNPHVFLSEIKT